jgi:hypothetical protein
VEVNQSAKPIAGPSEAATLTLTGVDHTHFAAGSFLCPPDQLMPVAKRIR